MILNKNLVASRKMSHKQLRDYIRESNERNKQLEIHDVYLFIKDPVINPNIKLSNVCQKVSKLVPREFFGNVDTFYVGQFDELKQRSLQALYKDESIYLSNEISSEEEFIKNIIHEMAHTLEFVPYYESNIFGDRVVEQEFLSKRNVLYNILVSNDFDISRDFILDTEYSQVFDDFLYKKVGYDKLSLLTNGLVTSPYSFTSLSEYFANGFEYFFLDKQKNYLLKSVSPVLYNKIDNLLYTGDYV